MSGSKKARPEETGASFGTARGAGRSWCSSLSLTVWVARPAYSCTGTRLHPSLSEPFCSVRQRNHSYWYAERPSPVGIPLPRHPAARITTAFRVETTNLENLSAAASRWRRPPQSLGQLVAIRQHMDLFPGRGRPERGQNISKIAARGTIGPAEH